jgi:ATP-dependent Clp protease ATP-binding subunit ClpA
MLEVLKGLVANIDPTSTESKEIDLAIDVERSRQMFKEIVRPDANYIGTEHLLLLALNTRDELLSELLTQLALDRDVIEQELRVLLRTN